MLAHIFMHAFIQLPLFIEVTLSYNIRWVSDVQTSVLAAAYTTLSHHQNSRFHTYLGS